MMSWKGFGRKRLWPNLKVLSQHLPGRTEENREKPKSSQSPNRELNLQLPECEGVLTTRPQCSVYCYENC
jgi:hypothetical protein